MKSFIVANWKCNPATLKEAKKIFNFISLRIKKDKNIETIICPSFIYLFFALNAKSKIQIGAQDCFWENPLTGQGAFTGEISPKMLKNIGCRYVIVGHSERRKLGEVDEVINKKIKAAIDAKIIPILCVENILQFKKSLKGINENLIIAYEPTFAIGTRNPCSIEKAKKTRLLILKNLKNKKIPILYGGSVNSENALSFIKQAGFQGLLIGGASLNPKEFLKIIKNCS